MPEAEVRKTHSRVGLKFSPRFQTAPLNHRTSGPAEHLLGLGGVLSVDPNGDVILVPSVPQEQFLALEARLAQTEKRLAELEGKLFALAACAE